MWLWLEAAIINGMSLLKIYRSQPLQAALEEITGPVRVVYEAIEEPEPDTMAALTELAELSPYLSVAVRQSEDQLADRLRVRAETERELIFVGPPVGTELAALVSAIVVAGRGDSGLSGAIRQALAGLDEPVHLELFTSPT